MWKRPIGLGRYGCLGNGQLIIMGKLIALSDNALLYFEILIFS